MNVVYFGEFDPLSILYLRCVVKWLTDNVAKPLPFNSLFEMRSASTMRSTCAGEVSTFNSLFEMLRRDGLHLACCCHADFQFSI